MAKEKLLKCKNICDRKVLGMDGKFYTKGESFQLPKGVAEMLERYNTVSITRPKRKKVSDESVQH